MIYVFLVPCPLTFIFQGLGLGWAVKIYGYNNGQQSRAERQATGHSVADVDFYSYPQGPVTHVMESIRVPHTLAVSDPHI